MKRLSKYFALFIIYSIICINTYAGTPKIYAIVVGVSHYKDDNIPNLKFPEKDAQAFYDFLRSPNAGEVPQENMALLIGPNATRGNVIKSMVDISKRSTKDDMVIFYFSGHGQADEGDNSGYLLNYDAEMNDAPSTALSMEEIKSRIDKCHAKLKVSYVDACHAGMFKSAGKGSMEADNEIIAATFLESLSKSDDGNVAFLASSAKQQSQESDKLGNGVFTYYLLKGLKGDADKYQKEASGYNDGLVTVGEMITYLNDKIPAATKYNQKPTVQGVYDEDFPLSILKTNVQIANEIAKRPERKSVNQPKPEKLPVAISTATTDIPLNECSVVGYTSDFYGDICFVNNYKEDILLYYYFTGSAYKPNVLISKDEKSCLNNVKVYGQSNSTLDIKFFFRTVDESKPIKYGVLNFSVQACKIRTETLSTRNLYLSTSGEKHD